MQRPYPREGGRGSAQTGKIYVHPSRVAEPEEWLYVLAHCPLHLGFGHFQPHDRQREWRRHASASSGSSRR